jgi:murein DD-endopeptidase MepM/ murein hydrolase activator NlpD
MRTRTRNRSAAPAEAPLPSPREPTARSRRQTLAAETPATIRQPRTLVVGLGSIISVLAVMGLLAAWGAGLTFIMVFGDRVSERIIAENSQMQDAYEQRLQAFRAEIARLTFEVEQSKFDTTSVEGRVIELGRRQRQLEIRLLALKQLSDVVGLSTGAAPSLTPGPAAPAPAAPATPPARRIRFDAKELDAGELDAQDAPRFGPNPFIDAPQAQPLLIPVQAEAPPTMEQALQPREQSTDIDGFILRMDRALRAMEQLQFSVLANMSRYSGVSTDRIRAALTLIGLSPERALEMRGRANLVIPNIVLPLSEQNSPFAQGIERARQNHGLTLGVRTIVEALPTTRPTAPSIRYSSGFGYRVHPLLGYRRLHAGVDMAAPAGTPIFAAGSGVVLSAGWGGGYGNLIQVDHGNGIVTRYAHLSQMNVATGQPVGKGTLIGLMGTTGASTGSHLHFETRIYGSPVNPACFLLAGDRIAGTQTVSLTCEQPPVWQKKSDEEEDDDN